MSRPTSILARAKFGAIFGAMFVALLAGALLVGGRPAEAQTPAGQITGDVPPSGFAIVLWSGGTPDALIAAASARGCNASVVWVTRGGGFAGYLRGAPAFVNQAFLA